VLYGAFLIIKQGGHFFVVSCSIVNYALFHCSENFFIDMHGLPLMIYFHSTNEMLSLKIIMY
jgi:hypothetical protein